MAYLCVNFAEEKSKPEREPLKMMGFGIKRWITRVDLRSSALCTVSVVQVHTLSNSCHSIGTGASPLASPSECANKSFTSDYYILYQLRSGRISHRDCCSDVFQSISHTALAIYRSIINTLLSLVPHYAVLSITDRWPCSYHFCR